MAFKISPGDAERAKREIWELFYFDFGRHPGGGSYFTLTQDLVGFLRDARQGYSWMQDQVNDLIDALNLINPDLQTKDLAGPAVQETLEAIFGTEFEADLFVLPGAGATAVAPA